MALMEQAKLEEMKQKYEWKQAANHYQTELHHQEREKLLRERALRDKDREFAHLEQLQQEKVEHGRQRFFNMMQSFQDKNDLKSMAL